MRCSWIEPGVLAASDIPVSPANVESLHSQGIRAILTLTERPLTAARSLTPALFARLDIALYHVPVVDQHPFFLRQNTAGLPGKRGEMDAACRMRAGFTIAFLS